MIVDHYSDYFELESLRNVAASTVIRAMKRNFVPHGIPDTCISDNGPQFDCHGFSWFTRDYGFALVKSSPYHSHGNGKAESAVKIAKNILKKSREEDPYIALLDITIHLSRVTLFYSPAQRLMDLIPMATSKLQMQLTMLSVVPQNIAESKQIAKAHYDKRASKPLSEFAISERVFLNRARGNEANPGYMVFKVVNKHASRSYTVSTPLGLVCWNHTQIRKASTNLVRCSRWTTLQVQTAVEQPEYVNPEHHASPEIVLRKPSKNWKLPSRLKNCVMNIS